VVDVGFGRLRAMIVQGLSLGASVVTLADFKTGAALATIDTLNLIPAGDAYLFSNTTTGDTTGGVNEDLWTTGAAHGLAASDGVIFRTITGNGAGGPTLGTKYFVGSVGLTATAFVLRTLPADGGTVVNVGATDASAATWLKAVQANVKLFHPTSVIQDTAGTVIAAADTAPNINRDLILAGKVTITVAEGGNLGTGLVVFIVDEAGIGDLALTV
jgi:hypothetical protein